MTVRWATHELMLSRLFLRLMQLQISNQFEKPTYIMGGLQTFAASARALGQSGESGRSMRCQIHKCCKRSNAGSEPTLPIFCAAAKIRFGETGKIGSEITAQSLHSLVPSVPRCSIRIAAVHSAYSILSGKTSAAGQSHRLCQLSQVGVQHVAIMIDCGNP